MAHDVNCPTCKGTGRINLVFGERLRKLRDESGQSQEKVAAVVGLTRGQIANLETDRSQPNTVTIVALARHFNVTADYLLGLTALAQSAAPVAPEPDAWPSGFFRLSGDARLRECVTHDCGQHASIRIERDGVGSDHCEPCARKIAEFVERPVQQAAPSGEEG